MESSDGNSYKTVRFDFIFERMWKECHEIICIVEDGIALHDTDYF